jgi:SusD family.
VKFLKAYYHFLLFKHFGPIPIKDKNADISASVEEVRDPRQPVDEVVDYIVRVMEEVIQSQSLPGLVLDENQELGRITQPIAMGIKAKVLVYAASPLFNGNGEYANFVNKDGTQLFNQVYSEEKWQKAVDACKEAIDKCHELGYNLHTYEPTILTQRISEESKIQMNIRGTLTERWNNEIIWAQTNANTRNLQIWSAPRGLEPAQIAYTGANGSHGATLNVAYLFYTHNGVPIDEDKTWDYGSRLVLRTATSEDRYRIKPGYATVNLHFDREPRFYASLGFDGNIWYGNGKYDDANLYWLEMKSGQFLGKQEDGWHPYCGYFIKKLINVTNTAPERTSYTTTNWPWVLLRLGDLYLLYAEAMNELNGPNPESMRYLDLIRERAGIPDVETAWTNFSNNPNKYQTKAGLREIIQDERTVEMLFEGERFWDLRRWKLAPRVLNQSILGWHTDHSTPEEYYRERAVFQQTFTLKDYFWPIRESDLIRNTNLVQNPGW